ncbi:hypothetical protein AK812_SmicGene1475 [Symbiodinium microadriaticum]|uniref:Uncharacterized protein n=1 Tax=Symbiodinium microadriaticum TaxID=2951 RepID=A0A1Q9F3S3_SYMMI|nr:hypothetical protein AK812_SmicGene1475 [Symbiodinium microadriaticum]
MLCEWQRFRGAAGHRLPLPKDPEFALGPLPRRRGRNARPLAANAPAAAHSEAVFPDLFTQRHESRIPLLEDR